MEKGARDDPDAMVLMADHLFLACGGNEVGALYEAAIKISPDHVRANLGLGEWHAVHGRYGKALPYLDSAVRIAKKDSPEWRHATAVLNYVRSRDRSP